MMTDYELKLDRKVRDLSSKERDILVADLQKTIDIDNENWSRSCALMHTIEELELVGPHLTPKEVLHRLFHEESLRMFYHQSIEFGCSCSVEKVSKALSIYSAKDIQSMTTTNGDVTADCQFCGAHFILNPSQLGFEVEG